ncbi:MAG: hypothetical protein ACREJC_03915 [Tepidisphaeraceae bacterium]
MRFVPTMVLLALVLPAFSPAQTAPSAQELKLTVSPAAAPVPALRYRLMPTFADKTPGNAAQTYLLGLLLAPKFTEEQEKQLDELLKVPLDKFPRDEAREFLDCYKGTFLQLDTAARREYCRWDLPIREEKFATLLPHLGEMRRMTRLLSVRARLQLADGRIDDAVYTLQTGFAMASHLNDQTLLIQSLVADAMVRIMLERTRELTSVTGAPNLYWALSELPHPLSQMGPSMRMEQATLDIAYPDLRLAATGAIAPERWTQIGDQLLGMVTEGDGSRPLDKVTTAAITAKTLPAARAYLVGHGLPQAQVDNMPPAQAVAMYCAADYARWSDDMCKWYGLPYWQAREGLARVEQQFGERHDRESNPLLIVLPSASRAFASMARTEREIAAMMTVEAVRAFAASHKGSLPKSLDDLPPAPAPLDPFTGQPFVYETTGSTFTLSSPDPSGNRPQDELRVEVTLKP